MEPYILIAVVAAVLYVWWRILHFTFDLIERAHAELRRQAEPDSRLEDAQATEGKVV